MGRSTRITFGEIRSVFRLIGEIRELGTCPEIWRAHMLKSLHALVGTRAGYVIQSRPVVDAPPAPIVSVLSDGLQPSHQHLFMQFLATGDASRDHMLVGATNLFMAGKSFTRTRDELVEDREKTRRSYVYQRYYRTIEVDDCLVSEQFLPRSLGCHAMVLLRDIKHRSHIARRERTLVELLHAELGHLWNSAAASISGPRLTPREAQTLSMLRAGLSEKQASYHLGLSRHTVHGLIKQLHRHFNVETRAELISATLPKAPILFPMISN